MGEVIRVQMKENVIALMKKEFKNVLVNKGAKVYNNYSTLAWDYRLHVLSKEPAN